MRGARRGSLQLGESVRSPCFLQPGTEEAAWPWDLVSEQLSAWGRGGGVSALREGFLEEEVEEELELSCQV